MNQMKRLLVQILFACAAFALVFSTVIPVHAANQKDYTLTTAGMISWMLDTKTLTKLQKQDLEQAREVIQKAEDESFSKWYGGDKVHFSDDRNDKITDLSDPNDAVSLRHVMTSIEVLKRINQLRRQDDLYSALNMKEAYTNFYFMAVAETGAMRGAGLWRHALLQVSCENLSFNTMKPVDIWCTEKRAFIKIMEELGIDKITSNDQLKQIEKYADDNKMVIGHYTNLFYKDEQVMGVGFTPYNRVFCYNAASSITHQDDRYNRGEHMYTIDEYEALVKEFCAYVGVHDYEETGVVKEATCDKPGSALYTCQICGHSEQKTIPAKGHQWNKNYTTDKEASCSEAGTESIHCSICDAVKEGSARAIEKRSHEYGKWEIITEATYDQTGLKRRTCKYCDSCQEQEMPVLIKTEPADSTENHPVADKLNPDSTEEAKPRENVSQKVSTGISPNSPVTKEAVDKLIRSQKSDADAKGSNFGLLSAKGTVKSKRSIRISWNRVKGASGYIIYGNACGARNPYRKITQTSRISYTQGKLKKGTYYKYLVVAIRGNKAIAISKTVHVATKGGKVGNNKKLKTAAKKKRIPFCRKEFT